MLVLIAACGGGGRKRVHRPGEEYLAGIKIEGNRAIEDDKLRKGLVLNRAIGRGVDEYQINSDASRITGAYQRLGFFAADVKSHVVRSGDATTVVFTVAEGARATAQIEIAGLPPEVPADRARALVKLADGAPFDYEPFDAAKTPLLALVEDAGYAHAQLDAAVLADRTTNRAVLRYAIDPGPRVKFGEITMTGVPERLAEAARERATFSPGDWYSARELAKTQQAIAGLRRFSSVRIDVDRTSEAVVVPVKIQLAEAKHWELRAGAGLGFDSLTYQARGRASLTHSGWPTPLTTIGVESKAALTVLRDNCEQANVWDCEIEPLGRLLGTISQQDLFHRDVKGEIEGGADYITSEAFTTEGLRARLGLSSPLGWSKLEARIGWMYGYYWFPEARINNAIDAPEKEILGINHDEQIGAFTQTISLDLRDNPFEPTIGAYFELRMAEAGAYALSKYDYLQYGPDVRGYAPLPGNLVLAARARLGVISGDVPPTERYFGGGASSQRGFAERHLSPSITAVDPNGNVLSVIVGGAALFETGLELRGKIELFGTNMGATLFLDGADVTSEPGALDVTHLHWALGIGLRPYYLPIGPVRIGLAYRLNRYGPTEPAYGTFFGRFGIEVGIGEAF